MSREQEVDSSGLPSFEEFFAPTDYETHLDSIRDITRDIDCDGDAGSCPYTGDHRILRLWGSQDVIIGYSVSHRLPGRENPERTVPGSYGWDTPLEMVRAGYESERDVTFYLPSDTRDQLQAHFPGNEAEIERLSAELEAVTEPLPVSRYGLDGGGRGGEAADMSPANFALLSAVNQELSGRPVIASHNSALRDTAADYGAMAAAPWQVYDWLQMEDGPFDTAPVNRIDALTDRFVDAAAHYDTPGSIPEALRTVDRPGTADAAVADESLITTLYDPERWQQDAQEDPSTDALGFLDHFGRDPDTELLVPGPVPGRVADTVGGHAGNAIRHELERIGTPLSLPDDPERFLREQARAAGTDPGQVVDRYGHMAEDIAIAGRAVQETGGRVLVGAYDRDFDELPWVEAAEPRTVLEELGVADEL